MSKKVWKIVCVVSFLLMIAAAVLLVFSVLPLQNTPDVSIIGGADGPTCYFIVTTLVFHHPLFIAAAVFFSLFVLSLVVLLFQRRRKR